MCSPFDVETVDMRGINESDKVAEIEDARAKRAFDNWINSHRDEVYALYNLMCGEPATPLSVRYAIQLGYQNGFKDSQQQSREAVLPAVRDGSDSGQFLSTEL
jgi:hypothetical protein